MKLIYGRGGLIQAELEEWWQNERAKIKPLDPSYFEFTFFPEETDNQRKERLAKRLER